MIKLLLAISFSLLFIANSCNNNESKEVKNEVVLKSADTDSVVLKDTIHSNVQTTGVSISVGNNGGKGKDSTSKPTNGRAIIHNAPNQSKLDSIKNYKTKNKK